MKLVDTLPFRADLSIFLWINRSKKSLILLSIGCLLGLTSGCSRVNEVESIAVEIWQNGSPLECDKIENDQQEWAIQQLAFFISQVKLSGENTDLQPQLTSTPWQTDELVLIQPNLPDCASKIESSAKLTSAGNKQQTAKPTAENLTANHHIRFSKPIDLNTVQQLSFSLAVPFSLNHQNPLQQPSPLNLPSMFWSWRSGHKFLRLDMQSVEKNWVFHLGSVGCTAVSTMRSPDAECLQPNRVIFLLAKIHDGSKLVLHLDRLMANTTLQNSESCLFHSDQAICAVLMTNLETQGVFEWH